MDTEHHETVVEKVTSYVKDLLGIAPDDSAKGEKPEYEEIASALHFDDYSPWPGAAAPEPTVAGAIRIEPVAETTGAAPIDPEDAALMRAMH